MAYKGTEVPMYKSFEDIERLLGKYGLRVTCAHVPEDQRAGTPGAVIAFFQHAEKGGPMLSYRMQLEYKFVRGARPGWNAGSTKEQMARLMFYLLKAKLEMVSSNY